jgi:hypothetical protein
MKDVTMNTTNHDTPAGRNAGIHPKAEGFIPPIDPTPYLQAKCPQLIPPWLRRLARPVGWLLTLALLAALARWLFGLVIDTAAGREILLDSACITAAAFWMIVVAKQLEIWQHERRMREFRNQFPYGDD